MSLIGNVIQLKSDEYAQYHLILISIFWRIRLANHAQTCTEHDSIDLEQIHLKWFTDEKRKLITIIIFNWQSSIFLIFLSSFLEYHRTQPKSSESIRPIRPIWVVGTFTVRIGFVSRSALGLGRNSELFSVQCITLENPFTKMFHF